MEPASSALGSAALKAGVTAALNTIVKAASPSLTGKLKRWGAKRSVSKAANRADRVRMVKTIWQIDKAVDLVEFYYPVKVVVNGEEREVRAFDDVGIAGNVLLRGTVGQGKSILLRYLTIIEAVEGRCLPLFVELRRLKKEASLEAHLLSELSTLGLACDVDLLSWLLGSGLVMLFLDAFDEVREERREQLVDEVERLCRTHDNLRIVITSRPDCGMEGSTCFRSIDLAPLDEHDQGALVRRICHGRATGDAIVAGLEKGGDSIRELLTTPLMVALLVLRYRAEQTIPETHVAFFSELFPLLLQRHDKTKAGYVRPRVSSVGDIALERVFTTTCFLTRKRGESSFTAQTMYDVVRTAMTQEEIVGDAELVLRDISTISCLLLEEGSEYRFIHKAVQEFYAALFVSRQSQHFVERFYAAMMVRWREWEQELEFLERLDPYRCTTGFLQKKYEQEMGPIERTAEYVVAAFEDLAFHRLLAGEGPTGRPCLAVVAQSARILATSMEGQVSTGIAVGYDRSNEHWWWRRHDPPSEIRQLLGAAERDAKRNPGVWSQKRPIGDLAKDPGLAAAVESFYESITTRVLNDRQALQRAVDLARNRSALIDDF